jgi:hypothetical protein
MASLDLRSRVLAYEHGLILAALAEAGGNQRRAARPGTGEPAAVSPDGIGAR